MPNDSTGLQTAQNWNPVLRPAELTALLTQLKAIEESVPFLIGLSVPERIRLAKIGTRTQGFVHTAVATAVENPGLLPNSLAPETLQLQSETLDNLRIFRAQVDRLQEKASDTERLFANHLYGVTRTIYQLIKSPMRPAGLVERREELAQRFARKPKPNSEEVQTKAA